MLTADDHDLWKIKEIGSTCPLCASYEGRVYSKSGTNPNYPPLAAAFGKIDKAGPDDLSNTFLNIHPNCLHTLVKWTEKGKTSKQIQKARDFSSSEKRPFDLDYRTRKQREAYQEKERKRAAYRRDVNQWKKYQKALGENAPKTFTNFTELKYNNAKGWAELQQAYRDRHYLQEQLPYLWKSERSFIPQNAVLGNVRTIAGNGSASILRDSPRLAAVYGGKAEDWKKRVGTITSDKYVFDVHWYELGGKQFEAKLKFRKDR